MNVSDVVILGGGVIGLSLAEELSRRGATVAVLDQGAIGQEASWAGAGMLPPGNFEHATTPAARLRGMSHALWPAFSERLLAETGIDNGYRRSGGLEIRLGEPASTLAAEVAAWRCEQVEVEPLTPDAAWQYEPALTRQVTAAYRLPQMGQVRNPRHLKALQAACTNRGVVLQPGTAAYGFIRDGAKICAVRTNQGDVAAGRFVVAGGAWSSRLLETAGCRAAVRPLRGQIALLAMHPLPVRQIVNVGPRYIVPRPDGRILIGSTEEPVGFDKRNTAEGVGGLAGFAARVVPALAAAAFERAWAGLRPQSPDGLPYLGGAPGCDNLFVAAGHFRAGLQLSPATALALTQLVLGQPPFMPLAAFAVDRPTAGFSSAEVSSSAEPN